MPEDFLSESLKKAFQLGIADSNYTVDVLGDKGLSNNSAYSLTNLPNTFTLSAHGSGLGGFDVDATATNELASVIRDRVKSGEVLSLKDIAESMGSATNNVKRAIIAACYAGGYNFKEVKKLFPNLEELIAPSTYKPTSAKYFRTLTRPTPRTLGENLPDISPFFKITPTSTNVISQASDWLSPEERDKVQIPLTEKERSLDDTYASVQARTKEPKYWDISKYNDTSWIPLKDILSQRKAILDWQREQFKKTGLTIKDIEAIAAESERKFDELDAQYKFRQSKEGGMLEDKPYTRID